MSEPPRRKRFPLFMVKWHLSTAIVMMFVVGGLMWANVTPEMAWNDFAEANGLYLPRAHPKTVDPQGWIWMDHHGMTEVYFGWPLVTVRKAEVINSFNPSEPLAPARTIYAYSGYREIAIDGLVAVVILVLVWFVCESWIRRRAARKGA